MEQTERATKTKKAAPGVVGRKPVVRRHMHDKGWVVSADGRTYLGPANVLYIYIPDRFLAKGADE